MPKVDFVLETQETTKGQSAKPFWSKYIVYVKLKSVSSLDTIFFQNSEMVKLTKRVLTFTLKVLHRISFRKKLTRKFGIDETTNPYK